MAPSRGITSLRRCVSTTLTPSRYFHSLPPASSGHSRWSKIKHDKGKADAAKNRQRTIFAQEIATASRLFGPDLGANPRLADLIVKAKREGFAKASIEAAVARGQGRSAAGASLESVTVEGILPNNVAVMVECETDNKLRTLAAVRSVMKDHGGTNTPTSYLFTQIGRITFEKKENIGANEVLEAVLEAGALDVDEDEDGRVVVSTQPGDTRSVGEAMESATDLRVATSEIVWDANDDTKVAVESGQASGELASFVDDLRERESSVQSVAMNVVQGDLDLESWKDLQDRIGY